MLNVHHLYNSRECVTILVMRRKGGGKGAEGGGEEEGGRGREGVRGEGGGGGVPAYHLVDMYSV